MKLKEAQTRAAELVAAMAPYCERIEIAGSVRREKQDVKDIEIVCIPNWENTVTGANLFEETSADVNRLHEWAKSPECPVVWIKMGVPHIMPVAHPSEHGRQWKAVLADGFTKVDVFLCRPENWGAIFLIRTGSADFSQAVVTHARRETNYLFAGGSLTQTISGIVKDIETPEESDVFKKLGLQYVEPKMRHGWDNVAKLPPSNEPNTSWIGGV